MRPTAYLPDDEALELFTKAVECRRSGDSDGVITYAKAYKNYLHALNKNDSFCFGHYLLPSDIDPNPDHIVSPIRWRILEKHGSKLRLISEHCLFWGVSFGGKNWNDSELREVLNTEKYYIWFSREERSMILDEALVTLPNPLLAVENNITTQDHIAVLSIEDICHYFGEIKFSDAEKNINKEYLLDLKTDAAKAKVLYGSFTGDGSSEISLEEIPTCWWLRSEGCEEYTAAYVSGDGRYIDLYGVDGDELGCRPVIWIDIEKVFTI